MESIERIEVILSQVQALAAGSVDLKRFLETELQGNETYAISHVDEALVALQKLRNFFNEQKAEMINNRARNALQSYILGKGKCTNHLLRFHQGQIAMALTLPGISKEITSELILSNHDLERKGKVLDRERNYKTQRREQFIKHNL